MINDLCEIKKNYLQLIKRFEAELSFLPEGSLNRKIERNKISYYHYTVSDSGIKKQKYISNEKKQLRDLLNRKRFLLASIRLLKNNNCAIDKFISSYCSYDPTEIASILPMELENLSVHSNIYNPKLWANEKYDKSALYPERLIYTTINGTKMRSKSEAIIAGVLESNDIPYRYEAALLLDGMIYYPDFTILRPGSKKIIYWEHFGMADLEDYVSSMDAKMEVYRKNNITPWNNLIATYETKYSPISAQNIQKIIKAFLL